MAFDEDQPRDEKGRWTDAGTPGYVMDKMKGGLDQEKAAHAVAVYQSTLFDAINNELRYDEPDKYKEIIKTLDKISTDKTADKLYRGIDANFTKEILNKHGVDNVADIEEIKNKLVGKIIKDKAFMSTTRNLNEVAFFGRDMGKGLTSVIQVEGSKTGIEVGKYVNNFRARQEGEFLIKRGSSLMIKNVSKSKTGKLIIYTDIIE